MACSKAFSSSRLSKSPMLLSPCATCSHLFCGVSELQKLRVTLNSSTAKYYVMLLTRFVEEED
jgi:hypothetical protein